MKKCYGLKFAIASVEKLLTWTCSEHCETSKMDKLCHTHIRKTHKKSFLKGKKAFLISSQSYAAVASRILPA